MTMNNGSAGEPRPFVIGITGASGAAYGLRLLECLLARQFPVALLITKAAQLVIATETSLQLPPKPQAMERFLNAHFKVREGLLKVYTQEQWTSPVASGSAKMGPMIICPCSMGTLSAIATGASNNLLERAADVAIKERRQLILLPREMPFSAIHLENMLTLSRLGVSIMPACPGYYHQPQSVADLIDFVVARLLDHLDIDHDLQARWGYGAS
jgi:4-hydroxy-3-polyprenylbenzoate decarboxylase